MAQDHNTPPPTSMEDVLGRIQAMVAANSGLSDPQKREILSGAGNSARSFLSRGMGYAETLTVLTGIIEVQMQAIGAGNADQNLEKERKERQQVVDDNTPTVTEKRLEEEKQQKLKEMEARLQQLKEAWNQTHEDEDRLNARMKRKEALDETVLMGMPADELRRLEAKEKAELALLEANLERQKEIVKKEEKEVVDTGRKIGVQGEDKHVLTTMEEAAEGRRKDIVLTQSQAKLVSGVKEHREHIVEQQKMVETQKERVDLVEKVVDDRGLIHTSVGEIKQEVKKVVKEEGLSAQIEKAALEKVEKVEKSIELGHKRDVEESRRDVDLKQQKILANSSMMAGKLNIAVPTNGDSPTPEEYEKVFTAKANEPNCPEIVKTRLMGLVGQLKDIQKEKMELLAKEAAQPTLPGNNQNGKNPLGNYTQKLHPTQNRGTDRNDSGWQR